MYESRWRDEDAQSAIDRYGARYGEALAQRVYTSRLIGADSTLVLHGGGNTSVKASYTTVLGEVREAIFVKGSGWDLDSLEPQGLPGLDLASLCSLRALSSLDDESMVRELRARLLDPASPNPSVETLLHAFLPAKFIDHSHANAIIALTNTRDARRILEDCFGDEVLLIPYIMPGFELAKRCADIFDSSGSTSSMILLNHGLFTWGETAKESYENHLRVVSKAHHYLQARLKPRAAHSNNGASQSQGSPSSRSTISIDTISPALRGALALRSESSIHKRFVLCLRNSEAVLHFVNSPELESLALTPPLTPDHIIRTKEMPLILRLSAEDSVHDSVHRAVQLFEASYRQYVSRCENQRGAVQAHIDAKPRIILIPGVGLIGVGETYAAASVAADIYEQTIAVKSDLARFNSYQGLPELDLFDVEYWALEQAKLLRYKPLPLHGQVALITGGCGAIGVGIAKALKSQGAEVVIADVTDTTVTAKELGVFGIHMDVTSPHDVKRAVSDIVQQFGGLDIVVPNAGVAHSEPLEDIAAEKAQAITDVNFLGYFYVMQEAARIMKAQASGGNIIVISSKNVAAPGKEFSIYSATKAAGHQLGKVAALELAPHGIRVNMITPDAVFGSDSHQSGLWKAVGPKRAAAHGLALSELPTFYQSRNLLKTSISADDVGRAVLFFATNQTPTTGATLPVDGGIPEAFPR